MVSSSRLDLPLDVYLWLRWVHCGSLPNYTPYSARNHLVLTRLRDDAFIVSWFYNFKVYVVPNWLEKALHVMDNILSGFVYWYSEPVLMEIKFGDNFKIFHYIFSLMEIHSKHMQVWHLFGFKTFNFIQLAITLSMMIELLIFQEILIF